MRRHMADGKRYEITVVPQVSFLADQSDPAKNQYVFAYTITITNTGDIPAQAHQSSLDHHRRRPQGAGSQGAWRGRPAAAAEARRELRIHERRVDSHGGGNDARHLPDACGRWQTFDAPFRRSPCPCRARFTRRFSVAVRAVVALPAPSAHRPPDDADRDQQCRQCLEQEPPHDTHLDSPASRAHRRAGGAGRRRMPDAAPAGAARAHAHAAGRRSTRDVHAGPLERVAGLEQRTSVNAAWPAFLIGCRALLANPRTQPLWQAPCTTAAGVNGGDATGRARVLRVQF